MPRIRKFCFTKVVSVPSLEVIKGWMTTFGNPGERESPARGGILAWTSWAWLVRLDDSGT